MKIPPLVRYVADRVGSGKVLMDLLNRRVVPAITWVWDYLVIIGGSLTFLLMFFGILARPFYVLVEQCKENPVGVLAFFLLCFIGVHLPKVCGRKRRKA